MKSREELLLSLDSPIYLNRDYIKDNFNKNNSFKINANLSDTELYDIDLEESLMNKQYLIINMDATSSSQQKRFIGVIKDKRFRSLTLDYDLKIIVSSKDLNIIVDEVRGLIVI